MTKSHKPKILVFASGSKEKGGSGFRELVENSRPGGVLDADIVGVISNHARGGVWQIAEEYGIAFRYFTGPFDEAN